MWHLCFAASPLKKGEKGEIWTWPIYKNQLPVTCGDKEGALHRERLGKGEESKLKTKGKQPLHFKINQKKEK